MSALHGALASMAALASMREQLWRKRVERYARCARYVIEPESCQEEGRHIYVWYSGVLESSRWVHRLQIQADALHESLATRQHRTQMRLVPAHDGWSHSAEWPAVGLPRQMPHLALLRFVCTHRPGKGPHRAVPFAPTMQTRHEHFERAIWFSSRHQMPTAPTTPCNAAPARVHSSSLAKQRNSPVGVGRARDFPALRNSRHCPAGSTAHLDRPCDVECGVPPFHGVDAERRQNPGVLVILYRL